MFLINIVSCYECCGAFSTNCCGKCNLKRAVPNIAKNYGKECSLKGNSHDLTCEEDNCPFVDYGDCYAGGFNGDSHTPLGWKC